MIDNIIFDTILLSIDNNSVGTVDHIVYDNLMSFLTLEIIYEYSYTF